MTEPRAATAQMSFTGLLRAFVLSRGGWMLASVFFALLLRLWMDRLNRIDLVLATGVVVLWPILEWFFHRFLMHQWTFLPFHFTHDRHHNTPNTHTGLPDGWVILMYFALAAFLFAFSFDYLLTVGTAILFMLAIYEFVHFSCHCNYKPKTWWGWAIRLNHLQHHSARVDSQYSMLFPIIKDQK